MVKGDIVLITFPFTDLTGNKLRPAIILFKTEVDITVCFVTSRLDKREDSDIPINPTTCNGLRKESLIRVGKLATLDKALSKGILGTLTLTEIEVLNSKLKTLLKL